MGKPQQAIQLAAALDNLSQLMRNSSELERSKQLGRLRAAAFPPTHLPFGRHSPNSSRNSSARIRIWYVGLKIGTLAD